MQPDGLIVLLISDSTEDEQCVRQALPGSRIDVVDTAAKARRAIKNFPGSVILLRGFSGTPGLSLLKESASEALLAPVILLGGESLDEALAAGAVDWLPDQPVEHELLERAVRNAIAQHAMRLRIASLEAEVDGLRKNALEMELSGSEHADALNRVNESLTAEQRWLRALIEIAPAGIVFVNQNGEFVLTNPEIRKVFRNGVTGNAFGPQGGYTLLQADGSPIKQDDLPMVKALRGIRSQNVEMIARDENGGEKVLLVNCTPMRDEDDEVTGALAIIQDMTSQRASEAAVRQTRQEVYQIIDSINDGFFAIDRNWNFIYVNKRAAQVGGRESKDLIGKNLFEEFPAIKEALPLQHYREAMEHGKNAHFLWQARNSVWYEVSVYPTDSGIAIYWIDKTEQRQAEMENERLLVELQSAQQALTRTAIDARQTAREALASATQLEAILNSLTDAVIVIDRNGVVQRANSFAVAMFGIDPLRMSQKTLMSRISVRTREGDVIRWEQTPPSRAIHGELVLNLPVQLVNARGRRYEALVSALPLYIGNDFVGAVSVWNDITEREELRAQVEIDRARLETMIRYAPDGILLADAKCKVLYANPAAVRLFDGKVSTDTVLPDKLASLLHTIDGKAYSSADLPIVRSIREGKTFQDVEAQIQWSNGEERSLLINTAPILDSNGEVTGGVGLYRDITDLKRTRTAFRESEDRFRVALNSAPITVYQNDLALRYTWVYNPRHGQTPEMLLGKTDEDLYGPDDAARLMRIKRGVLESRKGTRVEFTAVMLERPVTYDMTIEPLFDSDDEVIGLTAASFDVTELRQLEAQQIQHRTHLAVQRQLFQHRESERTQIARDLHDGPLQDLIATSFGLVEAMSTDEKEDRLRKMRKIQEAMQRNIRDLRVFCNDLRPPVLAPFGLEKTIQSHMESFRMRFPDIKIYLTLMPDGKRIPENIRMTMYRIFQELMNNIVKHAHATELRVSLFLDQSQVVLEVKDNGVGFHVPTDWMEVAQQGHLGLIGMRERIESIGGTMAIYAMPGRGTRIEVTAPLPGGETAAK